MDGRESSAAAIQIETLRPNAPPPAQRDSELPRSGTTSRSQTHDAEKTVSETAARDVQSMSSEAHSVGADSAVVSRGGAGAAAGGAALPCVGGVGGGGGGGGVGDGAREIHESIPLETEPAHCDGGSDQPESREKGARGRDGTSEDQTPHPDRGRGSREEEETQRGEAEKAQRKKEKEDKKKAEEEEERRKHEAEAEK
eukprot:1436980-Rhodomonas_salina.1